MKPNCLIKSSQLLICFNCFCDCIELDIACLLIPIPRYSIYFLWHVTFCSCTAWTIFHRYCIYLNHLLPRALWSSFSIRIPFYKLLIKLIILYAYVLINNVDNEYPRYSWVGKWHIAKTVRYISTSVQYAQKQSNTLT